MKFKMKSLKDNTLIQICIIKPQNIKEMKNRKIIRKLTGKEQNKGIKLYKKKMHT